MRIDIKSWGEFVRSSWLEKISGKRIYIWGAYEEGRNVYEILCGINGRIEGFIDNDENKTEFLGRQVIRQNSIPENVFIIVAARKNRDMDNYLRYKGFHYYQDYIVIDKMEKILRGVDFYEDTDGNVIQSYTYLKDCDIIVQGYGSKLYVGTDVSFGKNCKISMGYNSKIILGNNCHFGDNTEIKVMDDDELIIGAHCILENNVVIYTEHQYITKEDGTLTYEFNKKAVSHILIGDFCQFNENTEIRVFDNASLKIGVHCTVGKNSFISSARTVIIGDRNWFGFNTFLVNERYGRIVIGNDCMFSNYVKFRSDSGHSLFDLEIKKDVNAMHKNEIEIKDCVWIGLDVIVLGDSVLEEGSVVGAGSLIKKEYPGHCVIVGNPAKIIRKNIVWDKSKNKDWSYLVDDLNYAEDVNE